ncbi:hypothetical protein [Pectinatus cerevisiiphilus]|uniref:AMP-binding enzyme n=1 Tax=Pectinatus cerevisiiphilus TaxID=86956 RepID=A0A4R3K3H9_9FIRM|nr:hypothetical protein [Pectinatus cerevisiiphilus]TCS77264.1 hypothetical protein EDC37_11737 [Pectinatus cerevisiiphilus]
MLITDLLKNQPKEKICFSCASKQLTYGELDAQSSAMAKAATFIKKGEKIFLQNSDPLQLILCFLPSLKQVAYVF